MAGPDAAGAPPSMAFALLQSRMAAEVAAGLGGSAIDAADGGIRPAERPPAEAPRRPASAGLFADEVSRPSSPGEDRVGAREADAGLAPGRRDATASLFGLRPPTRQHGEPRAPGSDPARDAGSPLGRAPAEAPVDEVARPSPIGGAASRDAAGGEAGATPSARTRPAPLPAGGEGPTAAGAPAFGKPSPPSAPAEPGLVDRGSPETGPTEGGTLDQASFDQASFDRGTPDGGTPDRAGASPGRARRADASVDAGPTTGAAARGAQAPPERRAAEATVDGAPPAVPVDGEGSSEGAGVGTGPAPQARPAPAPVGSGGPAAPDVPTPDEPYQASTPVEPVPPGQGLPGRTRAAPGEPREADVAVETVPPFAEPEDARSVAPLAGGEPRGARTPLDAAAARATVARPDAEAATEGATEGAFRAPRRDAQAAASSAPPSDHDLDRPAYAAVAGRPAAPADGARHETARHETARYETARYETTRGETHRGARDMPAERSPDGTAGRTTGAIGERTPPRAANPAPDWTSFGTELGLALDPPAGQVERAGIIASFILNAAMIPGWPPPRPLEPTPEALLRRLAPGKAPATEAELAARLEAALRRRGGEGSVVAGLLRRLRARPPARSARILMGLSILLATIEGLIDAVEEELDRLSDPDGDEGAETAARRSLTA